MSDVSPYRIEIRCSGNHIGPESNTRGKERYDELVQKLTGAGDRPIDLTVDSGRYHNPFGDSVKNANAVIKSHLSRFRSLTLDYLDCDDVLKGDDPLPHAMEISLHAMEGVLFDFTRAPRARKLRVAGLAYDSKKTYGSYPNLEILELTYYLPQFPIFALFPKLAQLAIQNLIGFENFLAKPGGFLERGAELKVSFGLGVPYSTLLQPWYTIEAGGATHMEVVASDIERTGTLLDGFIFAPTDGGGRLVVTGLQKLGHKDAVRVLEEAVWGTGERKRLSMSVSLIKALIQRGGGQEQGMIKLPTQQLKIVYDAPNEGHAPPDICRDLCYGHNFLVFTHVETVTVACIASACPSLMLQWVENNLSIFLDLCVKDGYHERRNVTFEGLSEGDVRRFISMIQDNCAGWIMTAETKGGEVTGARSAGSA